MMGKIVKLACVCIQIMDLEVQIDDDEREKEIGKFGRVKKWKYESSIFCFHSSKTEKIKIKSEFFIH